MTTKISSSENSLAAMCDVSCILSQLTESIDRCKSKGWIDAVISLQDKYDKISQGYEFECNNIIQPLIKEFGSKITFVQMYFSKAKKDAKD